MDRDTAVMLAALFAVVYMVTRQSDPDDDPGYEEPGLLDKAQAVFFDLTDLGITDPMEQKNVGAFLWVVRVSEGTADSDGYSRLVGGGQFDSFDDHPRVLVYLPKLGINSSAAGAYQILRRTWDGVAGKLGLRDFSPASQDAAAIELIRQRGAWADVKAGRFAAAVDKCKKEWASLPGAGYGQRENSLTYLQSAYLKAGGSLA
jgi:lysozyme